MKNFKIKNEDNKISHLYLKREISCLIYTLV